MNLPVCLFLQNTSQKRQAQYRQPSLALYLVVLGPLSNVLAGSMCSRLCVHWWGWDTGMCVAEAYQCRQLFTNAAVTCWRPNHLFEHICQAFACCNLLLYWHTVQKHALYNLKSCYTFRCTSYSGHQSHLSLICKHVDYQFPFWVSKWRWVSSTLTF